MDRVEVAQVAAAYVDMIADDGELKHPQRRSLHQELEDISGRDMWDSYISLSSACALRSWPVWRSKFEDGLPFANPAVDATEDSPILVLATNKRDLGRLNTFLDNRMGLGPDYFAAVFAGLACWAVNRDVLAEVFLTPPDRDEKDLYPEDWDPSLYASVAVAGGPVWESSGSVELRQAFWVWYIQEAVPRFYCD